MRNYDFIFFDLDGTLVDSGEGIMKCARHALAHFGIVVDDYRELRHFVGPPLEDSFIDFYGFSPEKAAEAVAMFRERYYRKGIYEQKPYDGVYEFLQEIRRRGYRSFLATSKMQMQAERVTGQMFPGIAAGLEGVFARDLEGRLHTKSDVIGSAIEAVGVTDRSRVLMIGDRKYDIEGANLQRIDSLGVTFGFGDSEELTKAGAKYIADSYEDILSIL